MSIEHFWTALFVLAVFQSLAVGSFVNVCIARMPLDRSVVSPPSHCPSCGHGIRPYDNIPVLSWMILRGRCRDCQTPISPLYPAIELLVGILGGLLFYQLLPNPGALSAGNAAAFGVQLVFVAMLVAQTYIDLRHYIIPNELSIYAAPVGIAAAYGLAQLGYAGGPSWQSAVVGALAGGGTFGSIKLVYWLVRRREGMGDGDIKLAAMIGAFLGLKAIPFVVLSSSVIGAFVGVPIALLQRKGAQLALPFGPFLAVGAIVYLLHGPALMERLFPGLDLLMGSLAQ